MVQYIQTGALAGVSVAAVSPIALANSSVMDHLVALTACSKSLAPILITGLMPGLTPFPDVSLPTVILQCVRPHLHCL